MVAREHHHRRLRKHFLVLVAELVPLGHGASSVADVTYTVALGVTAPCAHKLVAQQIVDERLLAASGQCSKPAAAARREQGLPLKIKRDTFWPAVVSLVILPVKFKLAPS